HPAESERVFAERGTQPIVAGRRRIAFVEHQIDDPEHRGEALGELLAARYFELYAMLGKGSLRPYDALRDRRLGQEKGARDLHRRQSAEQAQRECDPGLGGERRMARHEDESEEIVAELIVERRVNVGTPIVVVELAGDLLLLAIVQSAFPHEIDR